MLSSISRVAASVTILILCFYGFGEARQKPEGWWKGMSKPNPEYDWLRPPLGIVRKAADHAYNKTNMSRVEYAFDKQLYFSGNDIVWKITLETPIAAVQNVNHLQRSHFRPAFNAEDLRREFLGTFFVIVYAKSRVLDRVPSVALEYEDEVILPSLRFNPPEERIQSPCSTAPHVDCWLNSMDLDFRIPESQSLKGIGYLLLRWHSSRGSVQHRIPINFDYLW